MRIVQLRAENFKRLGVVEITPTGDVVTIGGKNGQGKSSVLDAIWVALKGRAVAPPKPVRKGEERCTIQLDLGDLVVTRRFTAQENGTFTDGVKVENADGLRYSKPQEVLDALVGEIGFDPFEFVKLKPKDQAARLLEMVPLTIDLDEFAELDASDYAKRTEANRDVERLKAQVAGLAAEEVPEDAPDREALTDALGNAANTNAAIERERVRREGLRREQDNRAQTAQLDRERAKELQADADRLAAAATQKIADAVAMEAAIDEAEKEIDALPPLDDQVDTDAIREQLRAADEVLAAIERQKRRAALVKDLEAATARSQALTDAMAERKRERNEALAAAEMPVEGLAFDVDEKGQAILTFDGLPFTPDQISTAAMLRVSTAVGMAANPRLRVLRISDGSLLDDDSMAMLTEMAKGEEFQLWVEKVGEGEGVGIVMENGEVRGAETHPEPEPEEKPKAKKPAKDAAGDGEKLL